MLWVSPFLNLFFWIMYFGGLGIAIYFLRDWRYLNGIGWTCSIGGSVASAIGMVALCTTSVIPIV